MKKVLLLLVSLGLLFACAEKKVATMQEEEMEQPVEETTVTEEPITPVQEEQVQEAAKPMEMEAQAETAEEILKNDIHFDFDRYDIKADDKPNLKKIADWLIANSDVNIVIEGHCDERGTNEYNLGLGERRSNATKSYLMSLGVSSARMKTVSYGEERPLCTQSNENCWWRNRRAHFAVAN